jgi:hypothetical protein
MMNNTFYEHNHRSKKDNLLYTVKYGIKGNYWFVEVINNKNEIKFIIESDEWFKQLSEIMVAWGANERIVNELSEYRFIH